MTTQTCRPEILAERQETSTSAILTTAGPTGNTAGALTLTNRVAVDSSVRPRR
jgi:hypothetical protein